MTARLDSAWPSISRVYYPKGERHSEQRVLLSQIWATRRRSSRICRLFLSAYSPLCASIFPDKQEEKNSARVDGSREKSGTLKALLVIKLSKNRRSKIGVPRVHKLARVSRKVSGVSCFSDYECSTALFLIVITWALWREFSN